MTIEKIRADNERRKKIDYGYQLVPQALMTRFGGAIEQIDWLIAEVERLRKEARLFDWICAVAQPMSPHMDGTIQWRIPTHVLPRARSLPESIEKAILEARQ